MFIQYRTCGFILKKVDRGETDQLFTIFSKDFGKLEVVGRAIRKISSKLRSGAEIFYLSEIEFIQGKSHKTLTDAIAIDKFGRVRNDLEKLKISHQIAEIFDELVQGQEKDENLWHLLVETFQRLDTKYKIPDTRYKIYYYFFWNFLSILGYEPQLYKCALCQKKLEPQKLFFSAKEGGIICNRCQKSVKSIKDITPETVKILRLILKKDWPVLTKLKIEKSNLKSLNEVASEYHSYICKNSS